MDPTDPSSMLCTVERVVVAIFPVINTLLGVFLVHRRILADRDRGRPGRFVCKKCGLPTRALNLEELCRCAVPQL
jgi:hypothetical protein